MVWLIFLVCVNANVVVGRRNNNDAPQYLFDIAGHYIMLFRNFRFYIRNGNNHNHHKQRRLFSQ